MPVMTVACSDAPTKVVMEAKYSGDLLLRINEVKQ